MSAAIPATVTTAAASAALAPAAAIDLDAVVDRYIAAWNETDAGRRRGLVAATFAKAARYRDPIGAGDGHAGIDALIGAVQARFPGYRFSRRGVADGHGGHLRFAWDLAADGEEPLAGGTDFATLAADGRLAEVVGFLDYAPG